MCTLYKVCLLKFFFLVDFFFLIYTILHNRIYRLFIIFLFHDDFFLLLLGRTKIHFFCISSLRITIKININYTIMKKTRKLLALMSILLMSFALYAQDTTQNDDNGKKKKKEKFIKYYWEY